jgi:pimeloyl-ACP methyl ester carboxylesterase
MARIGLALVTIFVASAAGAAASSPRLDLAPCRLAPALQAVCGRFVVPEDRTRPGGRTISLRVAVIRARSPRRLPDPLVYLIGGPGGSAVDGAAGMQSVFAGVNERRDIVLVDQRGTGGSNRLECPVPRTRFATPETVATYIGACIAKLDADVRRYTTEPAMDDLADVVRALGYRLVNLYGVSYGATAAQYFLVQHPELVRTATLDGGTFLDVPIFELWGRNGERALRAVLERCAATRRCAKAYPRVRTEAFEMIDVLRRKPVRVQGTVIDAATAAGTLQTLTQTPDRAAEIPWIAHRARRGDWVPLAIALDRVGDGAPFPRQVMFWSIACNEPWARWRPAREAAISRRTYLAERQAVNRGVVVAACSAVPKAPQPAWSRARPRSDKPVLFVVGGADPQDPPSNVAGAARTLPNSRTVVVPAGGHVVAQLGCVPSVVRRFIERGTAHGLDSSCAARYAPPPFVIDP